MSVRENILVNLETALQGIRTEAGYNCSVGIVTRDASSGVDFDQSKMPAIMIVDDGGETPETPVGTDRRVMARISLEGLVKSSSNLSTIFNNFHADIRRCIHAANLGSNVIYHHLARMEVFTGEDQIFFTEELEIFYYYPEASP